MPFKDGWKWKRKENERLDTIADYWHLDGLFFHK